MRISLDSISLDFGKVALVANKDLTIKATNTAGVDLEIDGFSISGGAKGEFTIVAPTNPPIVISAGSTVSIIVRFSPKLLGARAAVIDIETSDGSLSVPLSGSGEGDQSKIRISLNSIDFGKVAPDAVRDTSVTIYSDGPDSATITGLEVTNYGNGVWFEAAFANSALQVPFKIAAGDSVVILIHFNGILPTEVKGGQFMVLSNATTLPTCDLTGIVEYGTIAFSFPSIDFGQMYEGEVRDTILPLRNSGDEDVVIYDLEPIGDDFSLLNPPSVPFTIRAGEELDFQIRANPKVTDSHFAQFQLITHSALPNLKTSNLTLTLLPNPLSVPDTQLVTYSCAVQSATELTIPIADTGSRPFAISSIRLSDSTIEFSTSTTFPDTISNAAISDINLMLDPAALAPADSIIVELMGGTTVIARDTIRFLQTTTKISAEIVGLVTQDSLQSRMVVRTSAAISDFTLTALSIHVLNSDPNVASIDPVSIALAPSLSGSSLTIRSDQTGEGFTATIEATNPTPIGSLADLLEFTVNRYVAATRQTMITASIVDSSLIGCLSFAVDSTVISGPSGCGAGILSDYLSTQPLITSISIASNPVTEKNALLKINARSNSVSKYYVVDALGTTQDRGEISIRAGTFNYPIPVTHLSSGNYFIRIEGEAGLIRTVPLVRLK